MRGSGGVGGRKGDSMGVQPGCPTEGSRGSQVPDLEVAGSDKINSSHRGRTMSRLLLTATRKRSLALGQTTVTAFLAGPQFATLQGPAARHWRPGQPLSGVHWPVAPTGSSRRRPVAHWHCWSDRIYLFSPGGMTISWMSPSRPFSPDDCVLSWSWS